MWNTGFPCVENTPEAEGPQTEMPAITREFTARLPGPAGPAVEVVLRLREAGHRALLVGGAVRDLVLGIEPGDFDVATDATPDDIGRIFPGSDLVGAAFGVMMVPAGDSIVETATFRREAAYSDGRHPDSVEFTDSPQLDSRRRDFTVNSLYLDPVENLILDFNGGLDDCRDRVLRAVGDPAVRFAEDGLRLLRAARLACQCGLTIERNTLDAMAGCADMLSVIAAERIGREFVRMLTGPDPAGGMEILRQTCLLRIFLPEAAAMHGVPQPPEFHPEGCVWTHTMLMLAAAEARHPAFRLAVLLHDVGKPETITDTDRIRFNGHAKVGADMTLAIAGRLRLPRQMGERAADLVAQHLRFIDVRRMKPSTLKRFLRQENFADHLELHRLDCLASHGDLDGYRFCRRMLREFAEEELSPPPLLRGRDLLEMGYRPGPLVGRILRELETAQLEGELGGRDAAMDWVRANFPAE